MCLSLEKWWSDSRERYHSIGRWAETRKCICTQFGSLVDQVHGRRGNKLFSFFFTHIFRMTKKHKNNNETLGNEITLLFSNPTKKQGIKEVKRKCTKGLPWIVFWKKQIRNFLRAFKNYPSHWGYCTIVSFTHWMSHSLLFQKLLTTLFYLYFVTLNSLSLTQCFSLSVCLKNSIVLQNFCCKKWFKPIFEVVYSSPLRPPQFSVFQIKQRQTLFSFDSN